MIECAGCRRHVRLDERACPFCRAPLQSPGLERTVGAAVTTFVLAACYGTFDGTKVDTGPDSGVPTGTQRITSYDVSCDAAGAVATYLVLTSETPAGGLLYQQETSSPDVVDGVPVQRSDEHDLRTVDAGDGLGLTLVTGAADPVRDESTAFSCAPGQDLALGNAALSYAFVVYDASGAVADCLAGGHDPQGLVDGTYAAAATRPPSLDLSTCRVVVAP